jgi:energy-coupling factor transporter ATP-binding protein EcfA2
MTKGDTGSAASWVRAALQVNPYCYQGAHTPSIAFTSEPDYNSALITACLEERIEAIAITDHWAIEGSIGLAHAAREAGIEVFPGFEATTSEGVHVLVIFPAGTSTSHITAMIGTCGGVPGKRGSGTVSFHELFARAGDDALLVPAHANVGTGLFGRLTGQQLERAVTEPALFAVGVSPGLPSAPRQQEIEKGSGPFARNHPLAFIHADDVCDPAVLARPGGSSWFKLSKIDLANLKMALRAPDTRVTVEDPGERSGARIREIRFEGGFLDEVVLPLSEELTTIIGGRGTGKSTIVESIRFALNVPPRGRFAKEEHARMVEHVLGAGAVVTVVVDVRSPAPNTYTVRRAADAQPEVTDAAGNIISIRPLDVINDVEIFGQHELAELAYDLDDTHRLLAENRHELTRAEQALTRLDGQLQELPTLQAQKDRYDEAGTADRLKAVEKLTADEQRFTDALKAVGDVRSAVQRLAAEKLSDRLALWDPTTAGRPALPTHEATEGALAQLGEALRSGVTALLQAADEAEQTITTQTTLWQKATADAREENLVVLRALQDEGYEPSKYLEASRALTGLTQTSAMRASALDKVRALQADRVKLLGALNGHRARLHTAFLAAVRHATAAAGGDVVVKPARNLERGPLLSVLRTHIGGRADQIRTAFEAETFSAADFVDTARTNPSALQTKYVLTDAQTRKITDAGEEFLRELEEITLPDAVAVQLNVAPEAEQREYRALEDLSRGQKATALLLLLLSAAETPLIIDQPEDDLDNRFIYRGIVRRIRKLKNKRQLIMTTHNANIPVLGDAELLIALESEKNHGRPIADGVGSIDTESVQRIAEDILEGGHEAFLQRQHRYGY